MTAPAPITQEGAFWSAYARIVRLLVYVMAAVAGFAILLMVVITCIEVILRMGKVSMTGVYDIVKIAGGLCMAASLPYTTACKGHVAIEYFFQKLSRRGRILVDSLSRLCLLALFAFLAERCWLYGNSLQQSGQVSPTLQLPDFYLAYVLAAACGLVCLIKIYHLFHPGKELIKP